MAATLTCWAGLAVLLVGLGLLVPSGFADRDWSADRICATFWLGWLVAILVLLAWSSWAAVSPWALPFLALLGLLGLWRPGAGLAAAVARGMGRRPGTAAAIALLVVWLSNRALGPPVGDSGLYHLSAIRWLSGYGTVPGLANIVGQFGLHQPSLVWSAALEIGPLWGRSSHVALGVLVAAIGARGLLGLARASHPGAARPVDVFAAMLLPVVVAQAVTLHELRLSGPDPDTAAALTGLAAATELVAALTDPRGAPAWPHRVTGMLLAALAAAMKPSMGVFGIGLVLIGGLTGGRLGSPSERRRSFGLWFALVVPLAILWLVRGVRLSGYPFYPWGYLPVPVDWRLPESDRQGVLQGIIGSLPPVVDQLQAGGDSRLRAWLVWQVTRIPELALLPATVVVAGLALLRRTGTDPARRALWLLVAGLPAVALWMASAPHPRLVYGVAWACAAGAVTAAGTGDLAQVGTRRRALLLALLFSLPAFPAMHRVAAWAWRGEPERAVEALILRAGPDHGFHPTPKMVASTCVTASGLRVLVPVGDDKMWDAPLPASAYCDPRLTARRPGDLGQGFRLQR